MYVICTTICILFYYRDHDEASASDNQQTEDPLSPGSISSTPSLPSEGLVDGSSICSNSSMDVSTGVLPIPKSFL